MATFKLPKDVVMAACVGFLEDPKNSEQDDCGRYLYVDILEIQRLYDVLKGNVYNYVTSIELDSFEVEMLGEYLKEVV